MPVIRLATVKTHKANVVAKERELASREAAFAEKEAHLYALLSQKDAHITALEQRVNSHSQSQSQSRVVTETRIREAIAQREEELKIAVRKREEEVAAAITRREEEIMEAVRKREEEICEAWREREEQIRSELGDAVEERIKWVVSKEAEIEAEELRLNTVRDDLDAKINAHTASADAGVKGLCSSFRLGISSSYNPHERQSTPRRSQEHSRPAYRKERSLQVRESFSTLTDTYQPKRLETSQRLSPFCDEGCHLHGHR